MSAANILAQSFKALHRRAGKPVIIANIYDFLSAKTVASLPSAEAIGTASFAIARASGTSDDDLTLEQNLAVTEPISRAAKEAKKPLTVDIQDGYGNRLEEAIGKLLDFGVSGINLEDYDNETKRQIDIGTAVDRIRRTLKVARERDVPDFVVNARIDTLVLGGTLEDVLVRGKKYLEAGANTVFVWGASRGVSKEEVQAMVKDFDGRLNVLLKIGDGGLTIPELANLGVARISIGPTLQFTAMSGLQKQAEELLTAI
ncbi:carboxyphosphonoenolpyruvate phosphonomutase-like protein [Fusarium austroafricanum]|uniref:Carboxyphosphonoenolpyruvate phosphonomutase-like protein n=1 Tax=Fusarium austroafricanum TaxID=2364996 RepID=A0A8H4KB78_9HYPO|nr:carboxyphosphonoenolpyruvate phosphonomutase-like protein [Fusarium austroafricanum]